MISVQNSILLHAHAWGGGGGGGGARKHNQGPELGQPFSI